MGACLSSQRQSNSKSAATTQPGDGAHAHATTNNVVNELDIRQLAKETHFTVNEVEALYELFKTVSNSLVADGLIHKTEFCLALFNNADHDSLFANRVFEIFDKKKNNVIEFGEFVQALSVFHPKAPLAEKAEFAFRIYDLGHTGEINRGEVRTMLREILTEDAAMQRLPPAALESIIDQTFSVASREVQLSNEDSIGPGEWLAFVNKMPGILNNMTLPILRDLTTAFPSFLLHSVASNSDMQQMHAGEEHRQALRDAGIRSNASSQASIGSAGSGRWAPVGVAAAAAATQPHVARAEST